MKGVAANGYERGDGTHQEIFSSKEMAWLRQAEAIVRLLPETTSDGDLIRCHEVARIVGSLLGLPVQDGRYGLCDHSWLWTRKPACRLDRLRVTGAPRILDPYCVGSLPLVRLLDSAAALPHLGWAYRPGQKRRDIQAAFVAAEVARLRPRIGSEPES